MLKSVTQVKMPLFVRMESTLSSSFKDVYGIFQVC